MKTLPGIQLFLFLVVLVSCQSARQSGNLKTPENPERRLNFFLANSMHQEAAWEYYKAGNAAAARNVLRELEEILKSSPVGFEESDFGAGKPVFATFEQGVKGVFKGETWIEDSGVEREVAAFRLDTLLGFYLTPLTTWRELGVPGRGKNNGSIQYFVKNTKMALFADSLEKEGADLVMLDKIRLFDAITGNNDRHRGNGLLRDTGEIAAIDHNRTFIYDSTDFSFWEKEIRDIEKPAVVREIFERYQEMPEERFQETLHGLLTEDEFELFFSARREIIKKLTARFNDDE